MFSRPQDGHWRMVQSNPRLRHFLPVGQCGNWIRDRNNNLDFLQLDTNTICFAVYVHHLTASSLCKLDIVISVWQALGVAGMRANPATSIPVPT